MDVRVRIIIAAGLSMTAVAMLLGATRASFSRERQAPPMPLEAGVFAEAADEKATAISGGALSEAKGAYWIGENGGYLAVYGDSIQSEPLYITPVLLQNLRLADQEMIRNGIWIECQESLAHFLEGFGP
ncbi:MAG: hypothetical protein FWH04_04105 [Oscillospiraceae bacterium]|nr:hypothetical protein [Oscillospiraceae bacterium]